jgi:hypothetical protein
MNTINQPSGQPTNKVAAATAALAAWGIIVSVGTLVLKNLAPDWYDPDMVIAISSGVPTIIAFAAGWFTKDKPNVVVKVQS